jgi:hypothetical protein
MKIETKKKLSYQSMYRLVGLRLALGALMLMALIAGHRTAAGLASTETRVFQQGLDGYAGVRDTYVSEADWETPRQHTVNYGQNERLMLTRDGDDNPLLRFDLSSIPSNSAVLSATLSLYNTTPSSISGTRPFVRRVQVFRILRDWDEGNQVQSPIDMPGKHGATGDNAFDYFTGEGTDVPWSRRGMAADADYAVAPESFADVVDAGWYSWDVTALVRAWVRGEQLNYGVVLRDATGYEDDHTDFRTFVSSQASDNTSLRPKLTVVYNPNTPHADAGLDQVNLSWTGEPIILDGSGSRDRPSGDNASLKYQWRVVQAAYGSMLNGALVSREKITPFTPDVVGEWEIELTVTNNLGESATDRVHVRLLSLSPASHPRIFLTPEKLAALRTRAVPSNPRWTQLKNEADARDGAMHAKALVYQITGEATYANQAIAGALALINDFDYSAKGGDIALVYDWCYDRLSADQRLRFLNYFNAWADDLHVNPFDSDVPGWGNYWPRYGYSYALVGLATYGDTPRAQEWLDEFRYRRFRDNDLPELERLAPGGAWPEGTVYDVIANLWRMKALEAWRTGTGENLFTSTTWFRNRLGYILMKHQPGLMDNFGYQFHPYNSMGDAERNRGSMVNFERIMALMLIARFSDDPLARQLHAYLAATPTDDSESFFPHEEFLWFNPNQPSDPPNVLTHFSSGTGTVWMRSGWPSGAADADPRATYITFQCGDHFTYHQHYDQNSFTLFKAGDLLVDSGVYSGEGTSNHDINYYVRTIAHNTLVVYNPAENFEAARPDASSNDGGQRTFYPASRHPGSLAAFDQNAIRYDTGDIVRFEDNGRYTYVLGDATKAYNNPTYNQASDSILSGNVAKVSRFQREFVYLRATDHEPRTTGEYVVIFDRVGVTQAAFSGENTKLLFHTLNEPTVNGTPVSISPGETLYTSADMATTVSGGGKVFIKMLLPAARNIRKVGGRSVKAFWVFGENYDWHWTPDEQQPRPTNDFEEVPYGEWRLELEPGDTALEHNFLTVLYPTSGDTPTMPATTLVTGSGLAGAHIADPEFNRVVLFSSASDGSAPVGTLVYGFVPTTRTLHVIFDLTPGARYRLMSTLVNGVQTVTLVPDSSGDYEASNQGILSFML